MQVLALTDALVFLQIVALYMVVSRLTRLESQLRGIVGSGPAAPRAGAPLPTGVAKPTSPRAVAALAGAKRSGLPTAESLLPDAPKKDFRTADEWAPLTPAELAVAVRVRDWLGAERFSTVPNDLLVTFIRGYAYRVDWAECTYVFLERALTWRAERKLDRVIARTMPNRHTFETVCPSGPVGFDDEGHMVICERLGRTDVARLFENFDEEEYIAHQAFSREVVRAFCTANSLQRQRRLYKVVVLLDMKGMGMAHVSKRLISIVKTVNSLFGWYYPETVHKFYVINAPFIFRTAWSIIRPLVHPITAAKFSILGPDWLSKVQAAGIELDGGDIPATLPSWSAGAKLLLEEHPEELLANGWMPPADVEALQHLRRT